VGGKRGFQCRGYAQVPTEDKKNDWVPTFQGMGTRSCRLHLGCSLLAQKQERREPGRVSRFWSFAHGNPRGGVVKKSIRKKN